MKRTVWTAVLAALSLLISCNGSKTDPDAVKGFTLDKTSTERLTQSVPSDASNASSITFEAPSAWRASARETRSVSWLTVVPDHGEAGTATVTFVLDPNEGTEARSAEITFTCEGGSFNVTITQEGQASVTPVAYEKHPAVPSDKRMAYAAIVDSDGSERELYVFSYASDGKLSKVTTFENVQNGFCTPDNCSEIGFTRSEGTTDIQWSSQRRVGAELEYDQDGMVKIDGKLVPGDRIYEMDLYKVSNYRDLTEGYHCKWKGSGMALTSASPDEDGFSLEFTYDEDGNLTTAVSKEDGDESLVTGEWKDGNLVTLKNTYKDYSYSIGSDTATVNEETDQISITYTDRLNPFTGVSINVFLFEDVFGLGPFLDDDILGIQTKNLPARLEMTSSYSSDNRVYDCSYTFDDDGRVTSASISSGSGSWTQTYRFHYSAQSVPVITPRENPSDILVSQSIRDVFYDTRSYSYVYSLQSVYGDGRTETANAQPDWRGCNQFDYPYATRLFPKNPERYTDAEPAIYDMSQDAYDRLKMGRASLKVTYVGETVIEEDIENGFYFRKRFVYKLDYGDTELYERFEWYGQSTFDYIAYWDGSKIQFVECTHLDPKDAKLEPTGPFYLDSKWYSSGKLTSAELYQPLRMVWPSTGEPVTDWAGSFNGSISITFAEGGVDE